MHNLGCSTNAGKDKGGKCFRGFEVFQISCISIFTWLSSMFINVKSKLCNVCTLCPAIRVNNITSFNDKVLKDKIFTGDNVFK